MTNEPDRRWVRRLIAFADGVLFGWFLFIAYFVGRNLIQISEYVCHSKPESMQPRLTLWAEYIFPDETWSMLSGTLAFSLGYTLISLTSNEAPTSRLFRWTVIFVITVFFGLSLPAMSAYKILSGGPDKHMSDEALFVALALTVLVYGIIRFRRHYLHQA